MSSKALSEINVSEPYLALLGTKTTSKKLRSTLIKEAPRQLYSVTTQLSRHLLNGTLGSEFNHFSEKFQNSLYILAVPSSTRKTKEKLFSVESVEFHNKILQILKQVSKN